MIKLKTNTIKISDPSLDRYSVRTITCEMEPFFRTSSICYDCKNRTSCDSFNSMLEFEKVIGDFEKRFGQSVDNLIISYGCKNKI